MPLSLPVLLALAAGVGCARPRPATEVAWTRPEYFDPATLHGEPAVGRARQEWYAATLSSLLEPSFLELARRPGQTYRFLWLRHWHAPLSVRVSRVGDQAVADLRVLERPSAAGPSRLRARRRVVLDAQDWTGLLDHLQAAGFWTAPTRDPHDQLGPEGARWVIEGLDEGRVHVVDRFSPDDPAVVALGLYMVGLAGLTVPPREVY
ncbi:hypothetical protein L6R53_16135 [Myxococcota bacterium]|nr:hypothetical protein [Myxococcota bacterium]